MKILKAGVFCILTTNLLVLSACNNADNRANKTSNKTNNVASNTVELEVTATAYTSHISQTDKTPFLTAWNNLLKPGMKAIAVSRGLLKMGLKKGSIEKLHKLDLFSSINPFNNNKVVYL